MIGFPRQSQSIVLNRTKRACAVLFALVCAGLSSVCPARAADNSELWPEFGAFVQLNDRSRACFDASYALGKESDVRSADVGVCLDVSLKPVARRELLSSTDWQRNRYLWARVGYDRIFEATDSKGTEASENRGIFALYGRIPLPANTWIETRTRADFRSIGGEHSNRYRFRLDLSREFAVRDHPVVPNFNFEWFYDTRYDDWARTLATAGVEVTATERFRYQVYLARQEDRLPARTDLNALGIVLKWFF